MRWCAVLGLLAMALACASRTMAADDVDPCGGSNRRALVLGTGGSKGSFEAGAAYHLIVHRGCDFDELSGNSVGALNASLLAQATTAGSPSEALDALRRSAEDLVQEWMALGESKPLLRPRPLGRIRLGIVGLDSIEKLEPLRTFVREHVALDRLATGRELRIGALSFVDGRYHEIVVNKNGEVDRATAHDYIYASMVVPVFGRMPVVDGAGNPGPRQFGDGGLRHSAPVTSYFRYCTSSNDCEPMTGPNTPPHPEVDELFVVVSSPYARRNDLRPVVDPKAVDEATQQVTDGRRILVRTFDLLIDTIARGELDDMLLYNDLLAWRAAAQTSTPIFPIGSYRHDRGSGIALPYEIALIAPQREDADPSTIFEVDPETIRRQLYCGCAAADEAMRTRFAAPAMLERCEDRFARGVDPASLVCRDERTAVTGP
jgi:predicted acylesterase/phospholipase RssA